MVVMLGELYQLKICHTLLSYILSYKTIALCRKPLFLHAVSNRGFSEYSWGYLQPHILHPRILCRRCCSTFQVVFSRPPSPLYCSSVPCAPFSVAIV